MFFRIHFYCSLFFCRPPKRTSQSQSVLKNASYRITPIDRGKITRSIHRVFGRVMWHHLLVAMQPLKVKAIKPGGTTSTWTWKLGIDFLNKVGTNQEQKGKQQIKKGGGGGDRKKIHAHKTHTSDRCRTNAFFLKGFAWVVFVQTYYDLSVLCSPKLWKMGPKQHFIIPICSYAFWIIKSSPLACEKKHLPN